MKGKVIEEPEPNDDTDHDACTKNEDVVQEDKYEHSADGEESEKYPEKKKVSFQVDDFNNLAYWLIDLLFIYLFFDWLIDFKVEVEPKLLDAVDIDLGPSLQLSSYPDTEQSRLILVSSIYCRIVI